MTYQGWSNWETWNVALWLDNEQGTYELTREMAEEAYRDADRDSSGRKNGAVSSLADSLRSMVEEFPDIAEALSTPGIASDLLGASLSEVNWHEIAENYIGEVSEDIDAEEKAEDSDGDDQ